MDLPHVRSNGLISSFSPPCCFQHPVPRVVFDIQFPTLMYNKLNPGFHLSTEEYGLERNKSHLSVPLCALTSGTAVRGWEGEEKHGMIME